MITEFLHQYGLELLAVLLGILFGYLGIVLKTMTGKFLDSETKVQVAGTVVRFVQQVYRDLDGPAKYEKALQEASSQLKRHGISADPAELRLLLEAAVNEMKHPRPSPRPEA